MSATAPRQGALTELKRLLPYVRRYAKLVWLGLLFITLSNVCSTTIPRVVGAAIDALKTNVIDDTSMLLLVGQILGLTIGSGFFMWATRRTIIVMSRYVEEDLRNDFTAALQRQSQRFFHERSTGQILAHFTSDIGSVREFIGPAIMYSANTITTFAFALSWMLSINVPLTASIVLPVPLLAWATYRLGRMIHERYKVVQEQYEQITTQAQETFSGVRVVRAYVREEQESQRFDALSDTYYRKNIRLARVNGLMMPSMTVLFNITYLVVIGFGGVLVMRNSLSVGDLTQFFIYLNQLLWPIAAIGWVTGMIQRGAASMGRLGTFIDAVPDIADGESTDTSISKLKGSVRFNGVSLRHGQTTVLNEITIDVPAGTSLGIVGHVGSGKSSMASLLSRLYDVSEGSITIDGHDVRNIPLHVLRGAIAMVPQEAFLFSDTIRNNVRFGRPEASDADVEQAAHVAQLDADIANLQNGYETVVGERGVTLSGGQKQRTALARAILSNPAVLILDDSLSAVDTDTEERILRGLSSVMQHRTTIMIAHRISTVQHCDTIIVLHEGKIIERGSHAELLALGGQYADMYERQLLMEELA